MGSAHRILKTLVQEEYVIKSEGIKKYLPSPKAVFPLSLYHPFNVLRRDAQLQLTGLRAEVLDTVGLVVFVFRERLLLDIAPGQHSLSPYYDTWMKSPLHGSASGKVLLLSLSAKERLSLLGRGPYEQHTPKTTTDPAALERELAVSRERGYVIAQDDAFVGLTALGAPIRIGEASTLGCFFVVGRSADFDEARIAETGLALKQAAEFFSHGMPALKQVASLLGIA